MKSVTAVDQKRKTARVKSPLNKFARQLLGEWKRLKLPLSDARVIVAVSGGADSVALLMALDELLKARKLDLTLIVAHLDHQLRRSSSEDARWVRALARRLGYSVIGRSTNVARTAVAAQQNLEQAARQVRYAFLSDVAAKQRAQMVLTAHTMDDQAETVLLNLIRGSGSDGLRGIDLVRSLTEGSPAALVRPLLSWTRRAATDEYCRLLSIDYLVDEMNSDERFARVRARRQLLPLMATFNPKIVESLARIAALAREDSAELEKQAHEILQAAISSNGKTNASRRLKVQTISTVDPPLRRRALRQWLKQCRGNLKRLERVHVLAVESLLFRGRGGRLIELPGGGKIVRKRDLLEYID